MQNYFRDSSTEKRREKSAMELRFVLFVFDTNGSSLVNNNKLASYLFSLLHRACC